MSSSVHRSRPKARAWSPLAVVLTMTAGTLTPVGLVHLILRFAGA